jgi:hypothetical protein
LLVVDLWQLLVFGPLLSFSHRAHLCVLTLDELALNVVPSAAAQAFTPNPLLFVK